MSGASLERSEERPAASCCSSRTRRSGGISSSSASSGPARAARSRSRPASRRCPPRSAKPARSRSKGSARSPCRRRRFRDCGGWTCARSMPRWRRRPGSRCSRRSATSASATRRRRSRSTSRAIRTPRCSRRSPSGRSRRRSSPARGARLTEVSLWVRNRAQAYVRVALPAGASMVSVEVAGSPAKPVEGKDGTRVPLLRPGFRPDGPYTVSFVYLHAGAPFDKKGNMQMTLPKMDLPVSVVEWELFMPDRYRADRFDGNAIAASLVDAPDEVTMIGGSGVGPGSARRSRAGNRRRSRWRALCGCGQRPDRRARRRFEWRRDTGRDGYGRGLGRRSDVRHGFAAGSSCCRTSHPGRSRSPRRLPGSPPRAARSCSISGRVRPTWFCRPEPCRKPSTSPPTSR